MKRLWNNAIFKNSQGMVRSGWILLFVMAAYYGIMYIVSSAMMAALTSYFISTGDINRDTGQLSDFVLWLNEFGLSIINQILTDVFMTAIPIVIWLFLLKKRIGEMGWRLRKRSSWEGITGMLLGAFTCTVVFLIVITVGGGRVESWTPHVTPLALVWVLTFILVAVGEETLNRGFLMSTLRRTRCSYCIMLIPSAIFGCIHLTNPNVTFFSIFNIVIAGLLLSYMYYKSGNLWMCIGFHFTWNTFQGIIYGIPVSGMNIPGILTTTYTQDNILNGGNFGIEGGILTTIIMLLSILFVKYYYRNSRYDFIEDKDSQNQERSAHE